eukprot:SM000144S00704  [mRNA]  locus=s144:328608:331588:- [translate_table: standard]
MEVARRLRSHGGTVGLAFQLSSQRKPSTGAERAVPTTAAASSAGAPCRTSRSLQRQVEKPALVVDRGPLAIIFEDDDLLISVSIRPGNMGFTPFLVDLFLLSSKISSGWQVVDKPAGIKHEPLHRFVGGSLVNRVLGYLGKEPYTLHRLDMYTSGVLCFAKTIMAARALAQQLHDGQLNKRYFVAVVGVPERTQFEVEAPISRDMDHRFARKVSPTGQKAITTFRTLSSNQSTNTSLLEAQLLTGRTHQIRVHLQHVGLPILCDEIYGVCPLFWDGTYGPVLGKLPTGSSVTTDLETATAEDKPNDMSRKRQQSSLISILPTSSEPPLHPNLSSNRRPHTTVGSTPRTRYLSSEASELEIRRCGDGKGPLQRQALHAAELTLKHPSSHARITFRSSLPRDIQLALACCGAVSLWTISMALGACGLLAWTEALKSMTVTFAGWYSRSFLSALLTIPTVHE